MYTINNNYKEELVIKNSKFITFLCKTNNIDDVPNIIDTIKKEYIDATHYCYAYVINNQKKSSDDGEPSGTAGIPILKVVDANDLTNILVVVVRYFGGIKLGANGLIRAYTKCVANAIQKVTLKELIKGYNVNIIFNYNRIKEIDYLLKDIKVINKQFNDTVTYNIDITHEKLKRIKELNVEYIINKEIIIEK